MKMKSLMGKKQWILGGLVVLLGSAVYLNYWSAGLSNPVMNDSETALISETDEKVYGEAQLVNGSGEDASSYFDKAALEREKSRDESVETVKAVLAQVDLSSDAAAEATAKIVELTEQNDREDEIESLMRAKGFEQCIVYLGSDHASVVVETDGLTAEEAAQIKSIILSKQEVAAECISITEIGTASAALQSEEET